MEIKKMSITELKAAYDFSILYLDRLDNENQSMEEIAEFEMIRELKICLYDELVLKLRSIEK